MAPRQGASLRGETASIKSAEAVDVSGGDVTLVNVTRAIYVGASGNIKVQFADDADAATVTLVGLAAGVWHPMQVQKVFQTGTTATGIHAGY